MNIPALDLSGTRAVTIAFWAKRIYSTPGTVGDDVLFEATSNYQNSTTGFALLPDDETCHGIQAALRGDEGTTANCYSQPSSGVWHHLAVVFDKSQTGGGEVAFYVDGVLQPPNWSVSAATNTNNFGNNPIYLFSRGGTAQFSSGTVDDLRVYNRALTAAQIQRLYNGVGLAAPSGSISYVQGNYATPQPPQTTVNVTFTTAQAAGDLNVVAVGWNDSTATVTAVTDSKGNVYTRAVGPTVQSGIASQSIYYAKNIASAAAGANTVTVTFSRAAVYPDIRILEYSGADPNNPVDVTAANSGNSTSSSSGSATTTTATDLIFGANLVQTLTSGPGSGFTTRMLTQPDGDIAEDRMVAATGSYSATAPVSPSGAWIMQMVAFRTPSAPVLTSITVTPTNPSIIVGGQQQFTATGNYSDGSHQNLTNSVTWTSSKPSVATISSAGLASGVAAGSTVIQATSAMIYGTTTLTVTTTGNFTISASPASLSIAQGNQGTSTITTTVSGGFSNAISLSATGAPTGTTVSFNPSTIPAPGSGTSTMTITVGASTATGTYPITVTGSGGGTQHTVTVTLTVTAAPNFTISASPASLSIAQGNQGTSTITTAVSGGFSNAISLSATGAPTGTTVSFNPSTIPAPGSGT
ncbi:MAG: LamG-like jellyroll fold domain-containing protein, partial [Candidatus Korobacteraceae bacterium]